MGVCVSERVSVHERGRKSVCVCVCVFVCECVCGTRVSLCVCVIEMVPRPSLFKALILAEMFLLVPQAACLMALCDVTICCTRMAVSL